MNYFKSHKKIILSILFPFLWICFITLTTGIYFETNDDRIFSEIFSGAMTGNPEFLSYCIHPILGLFIRFFYRISTSLPWYGLLLIILQWICHAVFTYGVVSYFESQPKSTNTKISHSFISILSTLVVYYAICFTFIARIQFTSTAAMLAVIGYVQLFLINHAYFMPQSIYSVNDSNEVFSRHKVSLHSVELFFILQVLSYLLRSDSMLMIQPYGIALLFSFALCSYFKTHTLDLLKFFCKALIGIILLILIGKGTHFLFYYQDGWNEYVHFSNARIQLFDYCGIPDYSSVQHILDKYKVSQKQYLAFFQYTILEPNLSGDCLSEIAEYAKTMQPTISILQILRQLYNSYISPEYYAIGKFLIILWISTIFYIVSSKKHWYLFPLGSIFCSRTVIWSYLIYRGRTPFRVAYSLFVVEILFILILLFSSFSSYQPNSHGDNVRTQYPFLLMHLVLCLGGLAIIGMQFTSIKQQNEADKLYNSGYQELINYCDNHLENHYILEASTLLYYRGSAFSAQPYKPRNCLISGCWYSGAPTLYARINEYASADNEICLIVSSDMVIQKEAVLSYFEEWRNTSAVLEDRFTVSNGGVYEVYKF